MSTLVTDTFTRSDSTTTLGNAESGQSWTVQTATAIFGVTSNKAVWISGTTGWDVATIDSGVSDGSVSLNLSGGGNSSVVFRLTDNNNYWLFTDSGYLFKNVAGSFSLITGPTSPGAATYTAKLLGSSITVLKNGVSVSTTSDSFNSTATNHGIGCYHDPTVTFDNFLVQNLTDRGNMFMPFF